MFIVNILNLRGYTLVLVFAPLLLTGLKIRSGFNLVFQGADPASFGPHLLEFGGWLSKIHCELKLQSSMSRKVYFLEHRR